MIGLFLLGYLVLALILCPVAIALYRIADQVHAERITRAPWDDVDVQA